MNANFLALLGKSQIKASNPLQPHKSQPSKTLTSSSNPSLASSKSLNKRPSSASDPKELKSTIASKKPKIAVSQAAGVSSSSAQPAVASSSIPSLSGSILRHPELRPQSATYDSWRLCTHFSFYFQFTLIRDVWNRQGFYHWRACVGLRDGRCWTTGRALCFSALLNRKYSWWNRLWQIHQAAGESHRFVESGWFCVYKCCKFAGFAALVMESNDIILVFFPSTRNLF